MEEIVYTGRNWIHAWSTEMGLGGQAGQYIENIGQMVNVIFGCRLETCLNDGMWVLEGYLACEIMIFSMLTLPASTVTFEV
jgi:hypothetical protein